VNFPLRSVKAAVYQYFRLLNGGLNSMDVSTKIRHDRSRPEAGLQEMMADFATLGDCIDLNPRDKFLLYLDCYLGVPPKKFRDANLDYKNLHWTDTDIAAVLSMHHRTAAKELHRIKIRLGRIMRRKGVVG
jgi:hypothetical protein